MLQCISPSRVIATIHRIHPRFNTSLVQCDYRHRILRLTTPTSGTNHRRIPNNRIHLTEAEACIFECCDKVELNFARIPQCQMRRHRGMHSAQRALSIQWARTHMGLHVSFADRLMRYRVWLYPNHSHDWHYQNKIHHMIFAIAMMPAMGNNRTSYADIHLIDFEDVHSSPEFFRNY
jgi:hypothetical protein